jgi:hypothetical protein
MMTRHDPEGRIVQRSWEDERFCIELAADPAGILSNYLQVSADRPPEILVHEKTAGIPHIVLPTKTASAVPLSETDLERVAGGTTPTAVAPAVTPAVTAVVVSGTVPVTVSVAVVAFVTDANGW